MPLHKVDFVNALSNKRVALADLAPLAIDVSRADVDGDGHIGGQREAQAAWAILDGFDHNGTRNSVSGGNAESVGRAIMQKAGAAGGVGGSVPQSVKEAAQFLLDSPNVQFWDGLSTGSDRKNVERLARGERALVPARGTSVVPKLEMMQALVAMAKAGPIKITALTGGTHSRNSLHYSGLAVDLSIHTGNAREIERIANQFGGRRNFERDHIHLSW